MRFKPRKSRNLKNNSDVKDFLQSISHEINIGTLDHILGFFKNFDDIDKQIQTWRTVRKNQVLTAITQIDNYNEYLKNKTQTDYSQKEIIKNTSPEILEDLVFTILNVMNKKSLTNFCLVERKDEKIKELQNEYNENRVIPNYARHQGVLNW